MKIMHSRLVSILLALGVTLLAAFGLALTRVTPSALAAPLTGIGIASPNSLWGDGVSPARVFSRTDNFKEKKLRKYWRWKREDPTHWSLTARPGFLRIVAQPGGLLGGENNTKNLLMQKAPPGDFAITTHLFFTPTVNFQFAGLLAYQDDDNYVWLGRSYCDYAPPTCVGNGIYFDHEEKGVFIEHAILATTNQNEAYLRIVRTGNSYSGYYSADNVNWSLVGTFILAQGFTPKVGLGADTSYTAAPELNADFDFFRVTAIPPSK